MKLKQFFKSKQIIYTAKWMPGVLLKTFTHKGRKYVRIGFPNRQKYAGMLPITDVLFSDVTSIRTVPSPFKKWLYGLVGKKPKGRNFFIKPSKK